MMGKTHALIGGVTGLALAYALQAPGHETVTLCCVGLVGALLPDVDSPQSTANRALPILRLLGMFAKHRGILHGLWLPALLWLVSGLISPVWQSVMWALAAGYVSHLLADAITIQGVPLFWPYTRNIHLLPGLLRIKTGGWVEALIGLGLVALLCVQVLILTGLWEGLL